MFLGGKAFVFCFHSDFLSYFTSPTFSGQLSPSGIFFPEEIFNFLYERTRRWNSRDNMTFAKFLTHFPRGPCLWFSALLRAEILRIFPRHATQNWLIDWIANITHLDSRVTGIRERTGAVPQVGIQDVSSRGGKRMQHVDCFWLKCKWIDSFCRVIC